MAVTTSNIQLPTDGSGKYTATVTKSEDAVTKHLSRVVVEDPDGANTNRLAVDSDGKIGVTLPNTVVAGMATLPAGDNNIGNVDVVTLPALVAGSAIVGKVGIDQTTPGTTNKVSIGTDGTVAINAAVPTGDNVIGRVKLSDGTEVANVNASNQLEVAVMSTANDVVAKTFVTKTVDFTASQTAQTIWDPTTGTKFVITDIILSFSAAGAITIFDGTDSTTYRVAKINGAQNGGMVCNYAKPYISATVDNILKYTTGAGAAGSLTVNGYEV